MSVKIFEAEVEVGLEEWDTEELEAELRRRDVERRHTSCAGIYESLYYALRDDNTERVMELAKYVTEAETGRILP